MSVEDDLFRKLKRSVENTRVARPMRMKVRRPPAQARRKGRSRRIRRRRRRMASRGCQGREVSQAGNTWTCSPLLPPSSSRSFSSTSWPCSLEYCEQIFCS